MTSIDQHKMIHFDIFFWFTPGMIKNSVLLKRLRHARSQQQRPVFLLKNRANKQQY